MQESAGWLIEGERVVRSTVTDNLVLTTRRLRHDRSDEEGEKFVSIPIEHIVSCCIGSTRSRTTGILGFSIAILAITFGQRDGQLVFGLLVGAVLLVIQAIKLGPVMRIASAGDVIWVGIPPGERADAVAFLNALEAAMLGRPALSTPNAVGP